MRIFLAFIIILSVGILTGTSAQKVTYDDRFKTGVDDFKQGRFAHSMEMLLPLTSTTIVTSYSEYAHYYYALSAYESKKFNESRLMLLQLVNRFPNWNRINDVNYLLGANSMATNQWKAGIQYFQKIKDSSFNKDIQSLKHHYLSSIKELSTFISLQKQYPDDRDVALALIRFIEESPRTTSTDVYYADQLVKQFKLGKEVEAQLEERPRQVSTKRENQWTKGYFNVSVLLPFRLEEYVSSKRRSNQFAYDYYQGLLIAKAKLKSEGIEVKLWAYDVNNETKPMIAISGDPSFRQSDLVIGPLYQAPFDVAAEYVTDANMIMLNPLSTDLGLLKSSSNIYLAHPSILFQVQRAAEWMKTFSPGSTAAIYYGNTSKDSLMAFAYLSELKSRGSKILEMIKIHSDREWLESKLSSFETQKPAHVALFSSEEGVGANLIEALNSRKLTSVPILATSGSFNLLQSRLNRYGARLFLIETDYVDREKEQIRQFQKEYWTLANSFPTVYSYQGYDQLLFFGRMLSKYKDKLATGVEMRRYDEEDYLLSGFDYTKSHENQIPLILKFNGSKWVPLK